ncbi:unnamed protein product [Adineta steineri]|uniref:VCBS repeat-containing protein n=1 Tax=Adineta steineri TaxID=433720 RepID=A0A815KSX2_9BILA|nr:unnamed protein product [Adineta steineri]CAF3838980.1 unnamed protein product [Adineta steineri]
MQSATGDFNGDGILDLALGTISNSSVNVFLGNKNGTFGQRTTYPLVGRAEPQWLAVADFNNDDHQDIFFMNFEPNSLGIFFGNGNGTFGVMVILPVVLPLALAFVPIFRCSTSDLNNDGHIDIVFTKSNTPCSISILLGYGNGTFAAETIISIGNDGCYVSIAIADFNNDDHQDIAVTIDVDFYVAILLGYGNGSFETPMAFSTGIYSFPHSIDVHDFNGDGYLDIVVANKGNYNIGVLLGKGDGSFRTQITTTTEHTNLLTQIAVGDFNGDGKMDIAGVCEIESSVLLPSDLTFITVLNGYGNGSFGQKMIFSTEFPSLEHVITNDFNGDGRLDLAFISPWVGNIGILLNTCACCALEISSQAYLSTNDSP